MEHTARNQEAIERAMRRVAGASDEHKAHIKAFNKQAKDWRTVCPKCKGELEGTLAELREHNCSG